MVGSLTRTIWFSGLLTATLSANVFGIALQKPQSYDDDGASDLGVYNYYTGMWWSRSPVSDESIWRKWGATSSHLPLPGDYDNDGKTDYATYDTDSGIWYIKENTNTTTGAGSWIEVSWGSKRKDSVPVPHDYDGDGFLNIGLYVPKDGMWYIQRPDDEGSWSFELGGRDFHPVPGYYTQTNNAEAAIFDVTGSRQNNWWIRQSGTSTSEHLFGKKAGVRPVPADYNGDGLTDLAVYDPSNGNWSIRLSVSNVTRTVQFGKPGDVPVPDDYDKDGKADIAVYRRSEGYWYIKFSDTVYEEGAPQYESFQWGTRSLFPSHLQHQIYLRFTAMAAKGDHLPIIYPENFNGTLWKTPNHSGDGTVVLLSSAYLPDYQAGLFAGMVVSSDPSGENVIGGSLGYGRIVDPYHERPAIRFDAVGTYYGSSPVYMVLIYKDGRRQPWYIPNPGVRTE